jgi:hypothetical protein
MRPHSKKKQGKEAKPLKDYSVATAIFSLHCFDEFFSLKKGGLDLYFHFTVGVDTK